MIDGITGEEAYSILNDRYKIVPEMSGTNYLVFISTVVDTDEDFNRLYKGLISLEDEIKIAIEKKGSESSGVDNGNNNYSENNINNGNADRSGSTNINGSANINRNTERNVNTYSNSAAASIDEYIIETESGVMPLSRSVGEVSRDSIYVYPPGIPIVAVGDTITEAMLYDLDVFMRLGKKLRKQ
jgi:arginine/lysine/ornithine decarboxylase